MTVAVEYLYMWHLLLNVNKLLRMKEPWFYMSQVLLVRSSSNVLLFAALPFARLSILSLDTWLAGTFYVACCLLWSSSCRHVRSMEERSILQHSVLICGRQRPSSYRKRRGRAFFCSEEEKKILFCLCLACLPLHLFSAALFRDMTAITPSSPGLGSLNSVACIYTRGLVGSLFCSHGLGHFWCSRLFGMPLCNGYRWAFRRISSVWCKTLAGGIRWEDIGVVPDGCRSGGFAASSGNEKRKARQQERAALK